MKNRVHNKVRCYLDRAALLLRERGPNRKKKDDGTQKDVGSAKKPSFYLDKLRGLANSGERPGLPVFFAR